MTASHRDYVLFNDNNNSLSSNDERLDKSVQTACASEPKQDQESEKENAAQKKQIEKRQEAITCTLSGEIFYDPISLPTSGHAIERDFAKKLKTDPWTRKPFKYSDSLKTDYTLKNIVDDFLSENPNLEDQQYGYQARKIEKEKKAAERTALAVANSQNVEPYNPVEVHISNIGDEQVSAQTLLRMMQHFIEQLDEEINQKYGCRRSDLILLLTNLFFIIGTGVSVGFLTTTIQHRQSTASTIYNFYTTPSFEGSLRHCDAWFDLEAYTCKSIDAWATPRTPACDELCDLLEPIGLNVIPGGISFAICALGLIISLAISIEKDMRLSCNRYNNKNLAELSLPIRTNANRLFSHLNAHNNCNLSLESTVGEVKEAFNEVQSRLRQS